MSFEEHSLKLLDFPEILRELAGNTRTWAGKQVALSLRPLRTIEAARCSLALAGESARMLREMSPLPIGALEDLRPALKGLSQEGIPPRLGDIGQLYYLLVVTAGLFSRRPPPEEYPKLSEKLGRLRPLKELRNALERVFDSEGNLRDDASSELRKIRRSRERLRSRLIGRLEKLGLSANAHSSVSEQPVTQRQGRYVIPILRELQSRVPGIVHDQSRSGATVYLEPLEVVGDNNELTSLDYAENEEIARIIAELGEKLAAEQTALNHNYQLITEIDLIQASGRLANRLDATVPLLTVDGATSLLQARHPILLLNHSRDKIVPSDLALGGKYDVLLITGPNAGGKTVSLKTMGLLTAMAQSGLPIPAGADSTLGWRDDVLADIGDEQSVAGDLSTFSYHIRRLGEILRRVESGSANRSLVLLDEIGTGTDPDQGAALSMAVLLRLQRNGTQVIATSHYDSLKGFVYGAKRMENAAVDFDQESLKPLYHLRVGTPGNSNTLSMARQFGLDEELIREAEGYLDEEYLRLDKLINEFEEERRLRQVAETETGELRRELSQTRLDNTRRTAALQAGKTKEMLQLREELYDELARIEGQIESAQSKLKRSKHTPTDAGLSKPRRKLREQKRKLKEKLDSSGEETESTPAIAGELAVGDSVRLEGAKSAAALIALDGKNATIAMGAVKMTVPVSRLTRVASNKRKTTDVALDNLALTEREVSSELTLRGMYVEEGLELLERYLDEAALVGMGQVRIIHGKGTWVMRNAVVDYLKSHPRVVDYFTPEQRAGGTGVTVAVLG